MRLTRRVAWVEGRARARREERIEIRERIILGAMMEVIDEDLVNIILEAFSRVLFGEPGRLGDRFMGWTTDQLDREYERRERDLRERVMRENGW